MPRYHIRRIRNGRVQYVATAGDYTTRLEAARVYASKELAEYDRRLGEDVVALTDTPTKRLATGEPA